MKQTKKGNGIGIVVAAYNAAVWIGRCLDSVLAAANKVATDSTAADACAKMNTVDVCVVVADDGSTDDTAAIVRRYAAADGRVRLLQLPHGGQAAARAAAITALPAWVDGVMIVDADDTLTRQSLSRMAAYLSADTDMVMANVAKYAGDEKAPSLYMDAGALAIGGVLANAGDKSCDGGKSCDGDKSGAGKSCAHGPVLRLTPAEALERMLNNDIPNFTHGMVVRRSLFGRIDWDTHPSMTNAEDAMLQLLLASAATGAVMLLPDVVAYEYRQRPGTLSSMSEVTPEGIARVWRAVSALPSIPRVALVRWGLGLMHLYLIGRGVWMPQDYEPLRDIVRLARHTPLHSRRHRRVLWMLRCPWLRYVVTCRHRRHMRGHA